MTKHSQLLSGTLKMIYPFVLIFGFYVIVNGHITPGGGFQGGAILAAVFVIKYLVVPELTIRIHTLKKIEKYAYSLILFVPIVFLFGVLKIENILYNQIYLVVLNVLIGIKVWCGLSILFFRFIYYERN